MLRSRLLTATAAVALFAAGGAFAQTAPAPAPAPTAPPTTTQSAAPADTTTTVAQQPAATQNSVVDVLRAQGQFTTLLSALDAAQLTETLGSQPAISIFAPTDAAFAALPEADRTRLLDPANVNELRQLLLYHVVVADVNSSQIEGARGGVQTAANTEVQLDGTGDAIKVDNATVTTADIDAGNGAVFIIDRVLNPAESQVASGDAEEAAPAAEAEEAPAATPPVTDEVEGDTPMTEETTDEADAPADTAPDAMAPPPTSTSVTSSTTASGTAGYTTETAPAAPGEVRPTDSSVAPAGAPAGDVTATTSSTPRTAPNGEMAPTTTTVAAPPVVNPTDGQVDEEEDEDTTAPQPQS